MTEKELKTLSTAQIIIRAAINKTRRKIIAFIREQNECDVSTIYIKLRLEQSVVSQHLAILRRVKLVNSRRGGKQIFYSVNEKRVAQVMAALELLK